MPGLAFNPSLFLDHVFSFFLFLFFFCCFSIVFLFYALFMMFTGGLQKSKFFATIPRAEMNLQVTKLLVDVSGNAGGFVDLAYLFVRALRLCRSCGCCARGWLGLSSLALLFLFCLVLLELFGLYLIKGAGFLVSG